MNAIFIYLLFETLGIQWLNGVVAVFVKGFLGWIALEAGALGDFVALSRIVDQHRERARVHGEFALLHRHVVADAVFGLARRINAHHRRAVVFVRGDDGFVEVIRHRCNI